MNYKEEADKMTEEIVDSLDGSEVDWINKTSAKVTMSVCIESHLRRIVKESSTELVVLLTKLMELRNAGKMIEHYLNQEYKPGVINEVPDQPPTAKSTIVLNKLIEEEKESGEDDV